MCIIYKDNLVWQVVGSFNDQIQILYIYHMKGIKEVSLLGRQYFQKSKKKITCIKNK